MTGSIVRDGSLQLLLDLVDEAFDHKAWHGTTLFGSIRGLTADRAAWRPAPRRHNVWEIVVHAAYWKYAIRRRLTGEKRGSFALTGSNWFTRPSTGTAMSNRAPSAGSRPAAARAWASEVRLLADEHRRLRQAITALPPDALVQPSQKGPTAAFLIRGIAAHDLYHAGQIQLLKRLQRSA